MGDAFFAGRAGTSSESLSESTTGFLATAFGDALGDAFFAGRAGTSSESLSTTATMAHFDSLFAEADTPGTCFASAAAAAEYFASARYLYTWASICAWGSSSDGISYCEARYAGFPDRESMQEAGWFVLVSTKIIIARPPLGRSRERSMSTGAVDVGVGDASKLTPIEMVAPH